MAVALSEMIFPWSAKIVPYYGLAKYALAGGIILCLFFNFNTLSKAGIWIADSLPRSVRQKPWLWVARAILAIAAAYGFYFLGQQPLAPLIWQALVIPIAFTLCLFTVLWSLMSLILSWSSRISFSRITAFILSFPLFALVPITAIFLGQLVGKSYVSSQADYVAPIAYHAPEVTPKEGEKAKDTNTEKVEKLDSNGEQFKLLAEGNTSCAEQTKEIQSALNAKGPEATTYWAIKAVKCTDMKSVVGLPRLAKIMTDHNSARVRAAAIRAMMKFNTESVRSVGYLLVKRISEKEPVEVIEAATYVLSRLGESEAKMAINRLKTLLENPETSSVASQVLVSQLKRADLVATYVSENLTSEKAQSRTTAIRMICSLPKENRKTVESHLQAIIATITTGAEDDPSVKAVDCLGDAGFDALHQEVIQPKILSRAVASRALASLHSSPRHAKALETSTQCARDAQDKETRNSCSEILGKIGAPALPNILELLESSQKDLKSAGRTALDHFNDPSAKDELARIRAENSGWMANKKNIQIANAVSEALGKIVAEEKARVESNTESQE